MSIEDLGPDNHTLLSEGVYSCANCGTPVEAAVAHFLFVGGENEYRTPLCVICTSKMLIDELTDLLTWDDGEPGDLGDYLEDWRADRRALLEPPWLSKELEALLVRAELDAKADAEREPGY